MKLTTVYFSYRIPGALPPCFLYVFTVWCLDTEILTLSYMLAFENLFAVTSLKSLILWLTHTAVASD